MMTSERWMSGCHRRRRGVSGGSNKVRDRVVVGAPMAGSTDRRRYRTTSSSSPSTSHHYQSSGAYTSPLQDLVAARLHHLWHPR
jgi:hypothetical protein